MEHSDFESLFRDHFKEKKAGTSPDAAAPSKQEEPLHDVIDMNTSNDDQIVEDLLDILQSYYKVSRKEKAVGE